MNVVVPDKRKIKNRQVIIYTTIVAVCAIAIIVAIYTQLNSVFDLRKVLGMNRYWGKFCKKKWRTNRNFKIRI